jgi:hypothetical protein
MRWNKDAWSGDAEAKDIRSAHARAIAGMTADELADCPDIAGAVDDAYLGALAGAGENKS